MSHALHPAQIAVLNSRTHLPFAAGLAVRFAVVVTKWDMRRRTRKHLRALPPYMLKDIGVERHAAIAEASKPFWQA